MIVGVLKEIKAEENRVCMSPGGVEFMRQLGHRILVEKNAGKASGFSDANYKKAGAEVVASSEDIFKRAKIIMSVKEPQPFEFESDPERPGVFFLSSFGGIEGINSCADQKQGRLHFL